MQATFPDSNLLMTAKYFVSTSNYQLIMCDSQIRVIPDNFSGVFARLDVRRRLISPDRTAYTRSDVSDVQSQV